MSRFATATIAALLVAGCHSPNLPEGEENAAQAAEATTQSAAANGVVPPDAETQPGYGTENAAGDVVDPLETGTGNGFEPSDDPNAVAGNSQGTGVNR